MSQATSKVLRGLTNFWWGDRGMLAFLLLLCAFFFLSPFFESDVLRSLSAVFLTLLLISGVAYISPRPLWRWITGAVVLIAIILRWLNELHPSRGLAIAGSLVALLCLVSLAVVVLIRVFRDSGRVNTSRVQGAVAAYVLFGVIWATLYQVLDLWLPNAFNLSTAALTAEEQRENLAYFSFVTLTTLGYGDITAVHPIARMFVTFEALIGQLYPATLLARLVSLEISDRTARRGEQVAGDP